MYVCCRYFALKKRLSCAQGICFLACFIEGCPPAAVRVVACRCSEGVILACTWKLTFRASGTQVQRELKSNVVRLFSQKRIGPGGHTSPPMLKYCTLFKHKSRHLIKAMGDVNGSFHAQI